MIDRPAAIGAARKVLESAPVFDSKDGGDGMPVVDLGQLVDQVLAAANPDALALPPYDEMLAQGAHYRLEQDDEDELGAQMSLTAHNGAVAVGVHRTTNGVSHPLVAGLIGPDFAWHTGIAWCVCALESQRQRDEKTRRENG